MKKLALAESASVGIGSDGTGEIRMGPTRYGTHWEVRRMTVTCTSTEQQSQMRLYRNVVSDTSFIDGTHSGNQDTNDSELTVGLGEVLIFRWEGADAGSVATVRVEGSLVSARDY